MLYYNFDGYEGFCCRFGFIEHDNGKKTRRNKILLDFIKDRNLLRKAIRTNNFSISSTIRSVQANMKPTSTTGYVKTVIQRL